MINDKDVKMLELLSQGASSKEMARTLGFREGTMRVYLHNLYRKLGPDNRAQMALLAREIGLLPPQNA